MLYYLTMVTDVQWLSHPRTREVKGTKCYQVYLLKKFVYLLKKFITDEKFFLSQVFLNDKQIKSKYNIQIVP